MCRVHGTRGLIPKQAFPSCLLLACVPGTHCPLPLGNPRFVTFRSYKRHRLSKHCRGRAEPKRCRLKKRRRARAQGADLESARSRWRTARQRCLNLRPRRRQRGLRRGPQLGTGCPAHTLPPRPASSGFRALWGRGWGEEGGSGAGAPVTGAACLRLGGMRTAPHGWRRCQGAARSDARARPPGDGSGTGAAQPTSGM